MRHYYAVQLYTLESLYETNKDQTNFVNNFETDVRKLSVFDEIHAQFEEEEEDSTASEYYFDDDESALSFIEMEEDIKAFCDPDIKSPTECEAESDLNISHSTFGSSQEGPVSDEVAHKHDIGAQLNQLIEEAHDLSFWGSGAQAVDLDLVETQIRLPFPQPIVIFIQILGALASKSTILSNLSN